MLQRKQPILELKSTNNNTGESFVWLCAMGLALGVIMVIGLIIVIILNGFSTFWPAQVAELTTKGEEAQVQGVNKVTGVVRKVQTIATGDKRGQVEWQLQINNREHWDISFKFLDEKDIVSKTYPKEIIRVERYTSGPGLGYPVKLVLKDGSEIAYGTEEFDSKLDEIYQKRQKLRHEIHDLEVYTIGGIASEIAYYEDERRRLNMVYDGNVPESELAKVEAAETKLKAESRQYREEAAKLRETLEGDLLVYKVSSGAEISGSIGEIVRYSYPNQLSFIGRWIEVAGNVWNFLTDTPRNANTEGGIFPAIFGTAVMTILLSIVVTPFGVVAAVYLREYAKQGFLVRVVRIAINNLAGVPSIVFGVFGLGFFVYMVGGSIDDLFYSHKSAPVFGTGGVLWAALTLALMTVPVVIVATEEALAAVPKGMREASIACGASKWQTIQRIVLPCSAPGILTGLILAMARGAGEVAPLMLVGVVPFAESLPIDGQFPYIHLESKFMHLGFHIYTVGFQTPDSEAAKPIVFASTLFLIILVVALNLVAISIREHLRRKYKTESF